MRRVRDGLIDGSLVDEWDIVGVCVLDRLRDLSRDSDMVGEREGTSIDSEWEGLLVRLVSERVASSPVASLDMPLFV